MTRDTSEERLEAAINEHLEDITEATAKLVNPDPNLLEAFQHVNRALGKAYAVQLELLRIIGQGPGISRRDVFVAMSLMGLTSRIHPAHMSGDKQHLKMLTETAVALADLTIAQIDKSPGK